VLNNLSQIFTAAVLCYFAQNETILFDFT